MKRVLLLVLFVGSFDFQPANAQVAFADVSAEAGIADVGLMNHGIAVADYDNDGWEDLYVARRDGPNRLYRNNGDGTYTDLAATLGLDFAGDTPVALWGDVDNDGWLDLYLGNYSVPDRLYLSKAGGTQFLDVSATAGMLDASKVKSAMFGDLDNDGWLDLYVARASTQNTYYHNDGNGAFTDRIVESGATDSQLAMGALLFDYDNDGDLDIYLTHDSYQSNILYQNDGNGQFSDVSAATGVNYSGLGMGVDFGDFNRDGWLDLYITNLSYNTLYLNNADGTFSNIVVEAGVGDTGMGWSTAFLDCDNDGWQDIYMVNGPPTPNILYQNLGDNTFSIASAGSPLESYGNAFGMACTDLDNDGRMDLFVANSNDAVGNQLFRNENTDGFHWLKVRTRGVTSNRAGIGARVEVEIGGELLVDEVAAGTGYASQNSLIQHFGLGDATTVDRLTVRWPSGQVDVYENLEADRQYLVVEGESLATAAEEPVRDALQLQVWPNPVQTELSVRFSLEKGGPVYLEMRDALGRPIARQSRIFATAGEYQLEVPTADLPAGTYALTLRRENAVQTHWIVRK